jgi:uncharacterized protein DUF3336
VIELLNPSYSRRFLDLHVKADDIIHPLLKLGCIECTVPAKIASLFLLSASSRLIFPPGPSRNAIGSSRNVICFSLGLYLPHLVSFSKSAPSGSRYDDRNMLSSLFPIAVIWARLIVVFKHLVSWWTRKAPKDLLLESLRSANTFEEWNAAAYQLDELLQYDLWSVSTNVVPSISMLTL